MNPNTESESPEVIEARTGDMLRKLQEYIEGQKEITTQVRETDYETVTTREILRQPSSLGEGHKPEVITVIETKPKTQRPFKKLPIRIKVERRFEEVDRSDTWNVRQSVEFESQPRFLKKDQVTILSADNDRVGTRTIYADSNTPQFSYRRLQSFNEQEQLFNTIFSKLPQKNMPAVPLQPQTATRV